ncbi:MAG TPA: tetratricopeptide repeat protein [Candidatus Dormibacteraeota bacterium]|nr:tetratricopeptide repeat protein [Candidatus Dormibacteraeota bacterium]
MDLLNRARDLYVAGRMHDALEAAQAACDREPKNSEAWWLLGRISRHTGLLAASDVAFHKAHELDSRFALPHRVPASRFSALIEESRSALPDSTRRRLEPTSIRAQPMPTPEQVRQGVDPDALSLRDPGPQDVLTLFQVNHENRSPSEDALQTLVSRSLAAV